VDGVRNWDMNASGTAWIQGYLSMTWSSPVSRVVTRIEVLDAGKTMYWDDIDAHPVSAWNAVTSTNMNAIFYQRDDASGASSGSGYMSMQTWGTPTGSDRPGIGSTVTESVNVGTAFEVSAYVRVPSGASSVKGRLGIVYGAGTSTAETLYVPFTATGSWTLVKGTLAAAVNHGSTPVRVFVSTETAGYLDVDEVLMTPKILDNDPNWVSYTDGGGAITWANYDDPANAHDGSYGVVKMTKSSTTGRGGILRSVATAPKQGETYTLNAWVRSPSGTSVNGTMDLCFDGGTGECRSINFTTTADGAWQLLSVALQSANTGHTGMHVAVLMTNSTGSLYVDDVSLQKLDWTLSSTGGSTATQIVINDNNYAQAGSGFLRLTNTGTGTASTSVATDRTFTQGTIQYQSIWVRSPSGAQVSGTMLIGPTGGPYATHDFTATGAWTEVKMSYQLPATYTELTSRITLSSPNASIDIDTMSLADTDAPPNGVTSPLDHPEWGYDYLWDNAFGIPGAHLWDISGQVEFNADGLAGIGMGATVYLDPTAAPDLMSGTEWIKGDMAVNVSTVDPCFSIRFDGGTTGSKLSIDNGVLTASVFYASWAPKGCTVANRSVPRGTSFGFTSNFGDTTVTMNLLLGYDNKGNRIFHGDAGVTNVNIGGTRYSEVELYVDKNVNETQVFFDANMNSPVGNFFGRLYLDTTPQGYLSLTGRVNLYDWHLAGGGFNINTLALDVSDQVPFAPKVNCGYIYDDIEGDMSMAKKASLQFSGIYETVCGELTQLHLQYRYTHGGVERDFVLDYDATTGILAGGASYEFTRSFSWKFLSHRYHRHPKVYIALSFSMDTYNPSSASEATLDGYIRVSGGSGSLDCQLESSGDDYCRIKVDINSGIGGGYHYEADW